jgi:serpin B
MLRMQVGEAVKPAAQGEKAMKPHSISRLLVAAMLTLVGACGGPTVEQAKSSLARQTSPQVAPADATSLVAGNTAFAADIFKEVRDGNNTMISPYSMSIALAMTYAGAKGDTATGMAKALHFDLTPEKLHPAFDQLDLALASRGQDAQGKDGKPFRLNVVNALWGQKGYDFVPDYLDTLAVDYGAAVNLEDFVSATEDSRKAINDWVAYQTEDKIKDLLAPGSIDSTTRLVLTNAVYFNASWAKKFEHDSTADAPFTLSDGTQVNVSTMHGDVSGSYADGADFVAAELPYDGQDTSMVVVVPKSGPLDAFEAGLDGAKLQAISAALEGAEVAVSLPKFTFKGKASLSQALTALGMGVAFSDAADFSGIHAEGGLEISDVIHQTFVAVDEDGTEAAAATAVVVGTTSIAPPGIDFKADRPFVFMIRDVQTGTILFLGHVTDPR